MTEISEPGSKLSDEDVTRLESRIGASLPQTYRRFLIETNGGVPTPDSVDIEDLIESPTDVQVFFGISRAVETSNIDWNRTLILHRIGADFLPIACDSGGNFFVLHLSGAQRGSVSYCEFTDANEPPQFFLVASSFEGFLQKLTA